MSTDSDDRQAGIPLRPSVHWAQKHRRTPDFSWDRKTYDFELLLVRKGELHVRVADERFAASENDIVLLPPGERQEVRIASTPHAELVGIHFDFYGEIEVQSDEDIIVQDDSAPIHPYCSMPIENGGPLLGFRVAASSYAVVQTMETVVQEWNDRDDGFEMACQGLLLRLFAQLRRQSAIRTVAVSPKYDSLVKELVRGLETNYRERWTNADMALVLNVHEDYMSKLFKDHAGIRPMAYLGAVRHREAKRRLKDSDDKIEVVAQQTGYDDFPYFCRQFKQREGMTPTQYRKLTRL